MLPSFTYVRPESIEDAVARLAEEGQRVHAGGTDLIGCLRDGVLEAEGLVSLSALRDDLRGVAASDDGGLVLGALTTISEIASHPRVRELYPGLSQAAASVGSPQLRNQGTIGGNLCQRPRCWYFRGEFRCAKKGGDMCYAVDGENRYHAILGGGPCYIVHPSDPAPMLSALGAELTLEGPAGRRRVPIADFYQLPIDNLTGETVLERGEIVVGIRIPAPGPGARSVYRKVRERQAWDFALASVALALDFDGARVTGGRIVLGGVAPVPWRSEAAEQVVLGKEMTPEVAAAAAGAAVADAEPLEQNGFKVALVRRLLEAELVGLGRG